MSSALVPDAGTRYLTDGSFQWPQGPGLQVLPVGVHTEQRLL